MAKKVQVLDDIVNSDFTAARNEYHFRTPFLVSMLEPLLKDKRDVPMICLQLNIVQALVPGVAINYYLSSWEPPCPLLCRNVVGLVYVITLVVLFLERFILMLHFSSHRNIWHNSTLNGMLVWVFSPFLGIPSGVYKLHHVIMHHIENNHEYDISSTENYRRDSWLHFAYYWFRFLGLIWVELPYYAYRTNRMEWFKTITLGLSSWIVSIGLLCKFTDPLATFWVFVAPHIVAMTAMSFGNWSQHIFVDPKKPESNYGLAYNCIDHPTNQTTFNDGYHLVHHLNARLHWSEMPGWFYDNKDKVLDEGGLVFRAIHFFEIGVFVMTKQLRKVAEHYVHVGPADTAPTIDEVEAKLRSWLVPVPQVPHVPHKTGKDE